MEQLTAVQKQLMDQNAAQKKEIAAMERKMSMRNDRVAQLELMLVESQGRADSLSKKYETAVSTLRSKVAAGPQGNWATNARIAKPLRGGGAASSRATMGESDDEVEPLPGAAPKRLSKMQSKRSSWYLSLLNKENR